MGISISKLDAAKSQLETAVVLFFNDGSEISIHTLTKAAHRILDDVGRSRGILSFISQGIDKFIKPEKRQEVRKILNKPQNFFKHAVSDPEETLDFNPEGTEYFLWDACQLYGSLTSQIPKDILLFIAWFTIKHPDIFPNEEIQKVITPLNGTSFNVNNKRQCYKDMLIAYEAFTNQIT
jgi:hypothetical protein